jgi:hypothetical protein
MLIVHKADINIKDNDVSAVLSPSLCVRSDFFTAGSVVSPLGMRKRIQRYRAHFAKEQI